MTEVRTISQKISFLFTAVTLVCVMLLNNQEIVFYPSLSETHDAGSPEQIQKSTPAEKQTVVKQKVSFEATTSYLILPLAVLVNWPTFNFNFSNFTFVKPLISLVWVVILSRIPLDFTIFPNAP